MDMADKNYYEILGVSRNATLDEIKKAHRKQALKYHPDRNPDDKEAEEMMKKVNAAFEELSDEDKRRKYDLELDYKERRRQNNNRGSRSYSRNEEDNSSFKEGWYEEFWRNHTTKDNKETDAETYEELFKEYLEKLKESYKNARLFEKKFSFKERREYVKDEMFYGDGLFDNCKEVEDYLKKIFSRDALLYFGVHSLVELLLIACKLKKLKTDDFSTYIMRNRRTFAGAFLAMYLLFGINGTDNVNQVKEPISITQEETENEIEIGLIDGYSLYRVYEVQPGDSLSKLSNDSNTTINYIMKVNNLDSTNIHVGQKLIIPYIIDRDELKYYTTSINLENETGSFEKIAKRYNTDVRTLYSINVEALHFDGEKYIIIADTILVPTFPTKNEVNDLKANDSYRKVS